MIFIGDATLISVYMVVLIKMQFAGLAVSVTLSSSHASKEASLNFMLSSLFSACSASVNSSDSLVILGPH